jgi:hypothetical protein
MGTTAIIITIAMAVVVLLAIGLNEIRSRNRRSDQRTNVPVVGDVLNRKEDIKDEQKTPGLDDFSPNESRGQSR